MALETGIQSAQPNELRREYHQWMDGTAVAASGAMNGFITGNKTGAILMVKATSAGGTPQYMLSLQTAYEDVDATYTDVIAISRPDLIVINDESWHVWTVNLTNAMEYARFYITLSGADAGDDKFYFHSCFLYGDFTQAIDVSLESPVVSIGSVKLEDGTTATNKADVNDADTARAPDTKVLATQNIDAAGLVHNLGTGVMAASAPVTIATDDTMIAALDAAVDLIQADTTAMNAKMAALGTAAMVASSPVTIATDDTMITALDAAVDIVAGDTTSMDAKMPALGTAAMVASAPVTIATNDTQFGTVAEAASATGGIHAQLRKISDDIGILEAKENYAVVATGAGAISLASSAGHDWELNSITVHMSAAPTTSQNLTFTLDANDGAAYDTVLFTCDPSASAGTDFVYIPTSPILLENGDEIATSFTNTDGITYGIRIVGKKLT